MNLTHVHIWVAIEFHVEVPVVWQCRCGQRKYL